MAPDESKKDGQVKTNGMGTLTLRKTLMYLILKRGTFLQQIKGKDLITQFLAL